MLGVDPNWIITWYGQRSVNQTHDTRNVDYGVQNAR